MPIYIIQLHVYTNHKVPRNIVDKRLRVPTATGAHVYPEVKPVKGSRTRYRVSTRLRTPDELSGLCTCIAQSAEYAMRVDYGMNIESMEVILYKDDFSAQVIHQSIDFGG